MDSCLRRNDRQVPVEPRRAWPPVCLRRGHSRRPRPTCSFPRKRESSRTAQSGHVQAGADPSRGPAHVRNDRQVPVELRRAWPPVCLRRGAFPQATPHLIIPAEAGIHRTAQSGHVQAGADPSRGPAHGFWFSTPRLDSRFRGNDEQGSRATACHPRPRMSQSGAGMTESPPLHGFSRGRANPKVIHQGWCPWNPTDFIPDSSPFQAPFWIPACAGMTKWGRGTW